jgi:hypothetical protein
MAVLLKKETPLRGIFKVWEAVLTYAQKSFHIGIFENAGFGWACRGSRSSPHGDGGTLTDAILHLRTSSQQRLQQNTLSKVVRPKVPFGILSASVFNRIWPLNHMSIGFEYDSD